MSARHIAQPAAGIRVESRAICYGKAPQKKALVNNEVKYIKSIAIHLLIVGVVTDQLATMIGRDNHCFAEALIGKRAFPRTCRSAHHHKRPGRYSNAHWHCFITCGGPLHYCSASSPLV